MTNIVMLCRGRLRLTEQAFESLFVHTREEEYTLTVVHDSGGDDFRISRLLRRLGETRRNFFLLDLPNSGHVLAQMKNIGVGASEERFGRGDWLYLSDSDVWFGPGWLEEMTLTAGNAEENGFRLFGGQVHPFHKPIGQGIYLNEHSVLDGPSWLIRWSTWKEIGGFERSCAAGVCQSEEYPWCEKLKLSGGRIGVISPAVVVHTGLSQHDGKDAPGRVEREKMIPQGVIAE